MALVTAVAVATLQGRDLVQNRLRPHGPFAVTDSALLVPNPGDWPSYGRDPSGTHFSPLHEIDRRTVGDLTLRWTTEVTTESGRLEGTPIVWNGTLFVTASWGVVLAVDGASGRVRWRWDPEIHRGRPFEGGPSLCCGPVNRGVALYGDRVFVGTLDGRLVALDARRGRVVWEAQTTPPGSDYSITGAPRVFGGRIIVGNAGADFGVRGFVSAYDPATGDRLWRTHTVPGDPSLQFESAAMEVAAQTWTGEWWKFGGGGTAWDSFSYDPDLGLLYAGTGNGSPWNHALRSPGGGDNLYLASILALDIGSGELVWHYQTTPGETWDYTATQTMVLATIEIGGARRDVLMQAPKNGFFYVLDRRTGELLSADPFTEVTWAEGVDLANGRPIERPEARYRERGAWVSPAPFGAHNWPPMSWSPETGLAYIPGENGRAYYVADPTFDPGPMRMNTGVGNGFPPPASSLPPDPPAFLLAWDPVVGEPRWRVPIETRGGGGTLATAGGLVFHATRDGAFRGYDAETGEVLWQAEIGPGPATPITYLAEGRQHISILSDGRLWTFTLP